MQETGRLVLSKLILLLFIFTCFNFSIFSQIHPDSSIDSLLDSGINKIILQDYDGADEGFSVLNKEYPRIPLGKIYLAAVEIARAYDYRLKYNSGLIMKNLSEAEEQAENLIETDAADIWNYYYLALAQGYIAYFEAMEKDWLAAFDYGIHSVKNFEICIEIDSSFYEAYTAIGTYKYWKSRRTEFIWWLPFIEDERGEGIKYLEQAVRHSSYNTYLASNSLLWIYIDRKEFDKAVKIAGEALTRYPGSRFFKFGLARAYEEINTDEAIKIYYEILESYEKISLPNRAQEITLLHIIAQQYLKKGNREKALKICNEILNSHISDETKEILGERFERIVELRESLSRE